MHQKVKIIMAQNTFIAANWGTTNLQLFLLKTDGSATQVVDVRKGPGASAIKQEEFETVLFETAGDWLDQVGDYPILLAGMVGSTIGWKNAGYVNISQEYDDFLEIEALSAQGRDCLIVKGLECVDSSGRKDIMRGEEVELAGIMAINPDLETGKQLVCIPGTHAKWIELVDGKVTGFRTSVAGELFAGLKSNGVLIPSDIGLAEQFTDAFLAGVTQAKSDTNNLVHQLFDIRTSQVLSGVTPDAAAERLSGLIIGGDVKCAVDVYLSGEASPNPITVIGSDSLTARYSAAIEQNGYSAQSIKASEASAAGFGRLFKALSQ